MTRYARLAVLLLPVAVGLASQVPAGRAQVPDERFAFADTTLLRDTLGLKFDGLFQLADSLGITPDTLRAYSIRHRMSLARLVAFADSVGMPVDSVGSVLRRERFNPLAARREPVTDLLYTTSYDLHQTSSQWVNNADFNLVRGPIFVRSQTTVDINRLQYGSEISTIENRSTLNEGGYRFSPDLSLGLSLTSTRYDNRNPVSQFNESETKNDLQISTRTRQRPPGGWTTEFNALGGLLDLQSTAYDKRGVSGDFSGRARLQRTWLTTDVNGSLRGNVANSQYPGLSALGTTDLNTSLDGTVGMFSSSPLSVNMNYQFRAFHTERVDTTGVRQQETANNGVNLSARLRQDNDRYITVSPRWATSRQVTASSSGSLTTREDLAIAINARYRIAGWNLDGTFSNGLSTLEYPSRSTTGGYGEDSHTRVANGTATRRLGPRITLKGEGLVTLGSSRYYRIHDYPNPPSNRDNYRQRYRVDGNYEPTPRFSTGVGLEVTRNHLINLPSASTAGNNETRSYRADWRWTYKLLPGLTANQLNQMSADYIYYDYVRANNRLSMDFRIFTQLSAVLGPHTLLRLEHDTRTQPSGLYSPLSDGQEYFSQTDEGRNYTLRAIMNYAPSPVFSLNVQSDYLAIDRLGQTDAGQVPQRESRSLSFSGGSTLNLPLGANGSMVANFSRIYRGDRSSAFTNGVPQQTPTSEQDYWSGRLEFRWQI